MQLKPGLVQLDIVVNKRYVYVRKLFIWYNDSFLISISYIFYAETRGELDKHLMLRGNTMDVKLQ